MTLIGQDVFGTKIMYTDFHNDLIPDAYLYPKIMPSSIREKLLNDAVKNDNSEIKQIVDIIIKYYDNESVNCKVIDCKYNKNKICIFKILCSEYTRQ